MKKTLMGSLLSAAFALALFAPNASADTLTFNDNVVAIFGAGNPNTGWTTTLDTAFNLELSLRAKDRSNGATPNNGAGTYSFRPGSYAGPVRARWNYEFSINSNPLGLGTQNLIAFDYYLTGTGPSFGPFTINALTAFGDNSFGNNSTANSAGVEGLASTYAGIYNVAQNSQNIVFAGGNPNLSGVYQFSLYATAAGAGANGARLAQTDISVNVPEPSSLALLLIGSIALVQGVRRRL